MNTSSDLKQGTEQREQQFSVNDSQSKTNNGHDDSQPCIAPKSDAGGSTLNAQPAFNRAPGETPAFSAFMTFFRLGHARSLQAVSEKLGETIDTVRRWSSKFDWSDRIQSYNAGLLQQQAEADAASQREQAAEWSSRMNELRRQEWAAAQKLLTTVHCFLETCSEEQMQKMTLSQVARALNTSSNISRLAITGAGIPEKNEPTLSPIQIQLTEALKRAFPDPVAGQTNTGN